MPGASQARNLNFPSHRGKFLVLNHMDSGVWDSGVWWFPIRPRIAKLQPGRIDNQDLCNLHDLSWAQAITIFNLLDDRLIGARHIAQLRLSQTLLSSDQPQTLTNVLGTGYVCFHGCIFTI